MPIWEARVHYVNDIWLTVQSDGWIGAWRASVAGDHDSDGSNGPKPREDLNTLGIGWTPSFEFPPRTQNDYLDWAKLVIGCVRGVDTLLSDEWYTYDHIRETSNMRRFSTYDPDAVADQQYQIRFSDTTWWNRGDYDWTEGRNYIPLGLEIQRTSYAWSGKFASKFIILEYWIKNVSDQVLSRWCVGFHVVPLTMNDALWGERANYKNEAVTGFYEAVPGVSYGTTWDKLNLAWTADNDGDPLGYDKFPRESPAGAMGVRILRAPPGGRLAFNWWSSYRVNRRQRVHWGPRVLGNHREYGRTSWSVGNGGPVTSRGWYRLLGNGEIDYPQPQAAIDMSRWGWYGPPMRSGVGEQIARGSASEYVLSVGSLDPVAPGDSVPLTLALIAGENFHHAPRNFRDTFDPASPWEYMAGLDNTDLVKNARWAGWVFDTPGYDTDGDGYIGESHIVGCDSIDFFGIGWNCDTVYYTGDGVPDFRGPGPPSPPDFEIVTTPGKLILSWDGSATETVRDPMSGRRDFEGYRLYLGKYATADQLSLITSWDAVDYKRMIYDPGEDEWASSSHPHNAVDWKTLMGDPEFDPLDYPAPFAAEAFVDTVWDTITNRYGYVWYLPHPRHSYWAPEAENYGNTYQVGARTETNVIQRVGERDTLIGNEVVTYGIYEATIGNLNPAEALFVSLTTFDFGDYRVGLEPLESSPSNNARYFESRYSTTVVIDSGLKVGVYPNPYKSEYDGPGGARTTYYREGYEGRGVTEFTEFDRRVHFINLPEQATIRIYSIDGDLIRTIEHPDPFMTTYPSSVAWDLVSRNAQAVVSGIYIWRVDSELGSQTGKLVIIK